MKDPAFLFYTNDFLSGTMLMNDEQIGRYIKLLCLQHQKGHLKEKDMLSICKTYDEDIFSKFKQDEDGNYYNERLEEEVIRRKKYSESRRNNRNNVDNSNTCVYLIQDTLTGLVKIGSSNNPERRLVELKNQYKNNNLILLAYVENVQQKLETKLHKEHKGKNEINEWFRLSNTEIQEIIMQNDMKLHMNNHMIEDMNNHMSEHMETETITENININNIIEFYNNNINLITPFEFQKLQDYKEMDNDLIIYAMQKAVLNNKRNFAYIDKILKSWKTKGFTSLIQAKNEENEYKKGKQPIQETDEEKLARQIREMKERFKDEDWGIFRTYQ